MKKNKLFLLGLFVVFAAVLSLSLVSNTLAKYTTSDTGTDTARVAKWGVDVVVNGATFATAYDGTVESQTTDKVVAPGTAGNFASITVTGEPEVSVQVTYDATLELGELWKDEGDNYYCPISITVNSETFNGMSYASADAFEAAVVAKIESLGQAYTKGTDLSAINDDLTISWSWLLADGVGQDNVKDTYLGDQVAAGNEPTITLTVKVTVDQVE